MCRDAAELSSDRSKRTLRVASACSYLWADVTALLHTIMECTNPCISHAGQVLKHNVMCLQHVPEPKLPRDLGSHHSATTLTKRRCCLLVYKAISPESPGSLAHVARVIQNLLLSDPTAENFEPLSLEEDLKLKRGFLQQEVVMLPACCWHANLFADALTAWRGVAAFVCISGVI